MKAFMSEPWSERTNPLDVDVDCFGYEAYAIEEARAILAESEPDQGPRWFDVADALGAEIFTASGFDWYNGGLNYLAQDTMETALAEAISSFLES